MRRAALRTATSFLLVAATLAATASGPEVAAAPPPKQPNIILITTDDQSVADLKHMPYTRELLGGGGVRFANAISPYPLCCPARVTLMTGQHAHNHGVLANKPPAGGYEKMRPLNDRTLPVWLQNVGYRTTFTGKYLNTYAHDDITEIPAGWDNWHAMVRGVYDFNNAKVNENGTVVDHSGEYQADVTQDATEEAIREGSRSRQPFFVWQSNLAPHGACTMGDGGGCNWGPPVPADQDKGTFDGLRFYAERLPNFNERVVVDKPSRISRRRRLNDVDISRLRAWNQASVESLQAVDRNVRDTVELLDSLGELDNTLIVFASDNGFMLGQHRWRGKTLGYEGSLRIPMLMRGPGVPQGKVVRDMVSLVDVPATFAAAAGAEPLLPLDGMSLLDVAQGTRSGYDAMAIEAGPAYRDIPDDQYMYRGVRTSRYTYMKHPVTGELELYDRKLDRHQLVNVAYRPTHRQTRKALQAMMAELSTCAGPTCHQVTGTVPNPQPAQGPVHPDELGTLRDAKQVVTVTAQRWSAKRGIAVAWQKRGRTWRKVRGPVKVVLGAEGMSPAPRRPAATTPAGVHRIQLALGTRPAPATELTYRRLGAEDRWPHDRRSEATYNVLQPSRSPKATWREGHELVFADHQVSFQRGLVMDFNPARRIYRSPEQEQWMARNPANVRRGSLLVHTGRRVGRMGWLSMPTRDLTWLMRWAKPGDQRTSLVVGTPKYLRRNL